MLLRSLSILATICLLGSCQKESQVATATRDGILLLGNSAEPKGLDPHMVSGVIESNIIRAIFEGLITLHPNEDLAAPGGAVIDITPDETATVWIARLRPNGKWSDGTPVTAHDYAFSYERMLTPDLGAKYASMLYFLEGAEAFNMGETDDFSTVGVRVIDDFTLQLTLRGPTPYFREILKHYTWYAVPRHIVLKHGTMTGRGNLWARAANIVGNGPYKVKEHRLNNYIEVDRNPHYWDADNVTLNGVKFIPVSNSFTEARMFRDGQLHITYSAASEVVDLMKEENPTHLRQEPYLGTVLYRFNNDRPPLDNPKVRRALSLAIDRDAICANVFRGFEPAYAMTPPMSGYKPPVGTAFDPETARQLLAEAGFPDGKGFPRFKLLIASREVAATLAAAIQAMWRDQLGIEVEIENKDWSAYMAATHAQEYDIVAGGWIGDYIDPLTFLEMWMPGSGNNNTGWANQEFAAAINASFAHSEDGPRLELLRKAEEILLEDAPIMPIAWWAKSYLIHPSVKGWYPLLLDNHPYQSLRLED